MKRIIQLSLFCIVVFTIFFFNKIYLSKDKVLVEKGIHKAEYRWEEFRTFTSFNVTKDINKALKLSFRSKGIDVEIGSFLNEKDKKILREEISKIIDTLNGLN